MIIDLCIRIMLGVCVVILWVVWDVLVTFCLRNLLFVGVLHFECSWGVGFLIGCLLVVIVI